MFKKTTCIYIVLILGLIGGGLFFVLSISDADVQSLKKLQTKAIATLQTTTEQNRRGVCKDLWIAQADGTRLHDRIESASSVLTITPVEDHLDIIEHLKDLKCAMQDRIEEKDGVQMQQVRFFDARTGTYRYSRSELSAETVSLALYRIAGTDLPSSFSNPFLTGIAQGVTFSLAGKTSQFQAKQFKATLVQKETP